MWLVMWKKASGQVQLVYEQAVASEGSGPTSAAFGCRRGEFSTHHADV
jgi:hypothetical protein